MQNALENLADWFSQDFDLTSGSIELAVKNFFLQNGKEILLEAHSELERVVNETGYSPELANVLMEYGWEWFEGGDQTGSSWLPKVLTELKKYT